MEEVRSGNGKGLVSLASQLNRAGLNVAAPVTEDNVAEWAEAEEGFVDDRPHILSDMAFQKRRADLEKAFAIRQRTGNAKPFKRLVKVVHWDILHDIFKGREVNPLTVAEYETYRDEELAKLPEDCGDPQFTQRANKRVAMSNFEDQLRREVFHKRSNVDLLEVEQAIIALEQKKGKIRGLQTDLDTVVTCNEKTGGGVCAGDFLPRCYLNRDKKRRGNYSPDLFDDKTAPVCKPCQDFLVDKLVEHNKAVVAACLVCRELDMRDQDGRHNDHTKDPKQMTAFVPRFLPKGDAEDIVQRRMFSINREKEEAEALAQEEREREGSANRFIGKMVDRMQHAPALPRGQNKKSHNRDRRKRDRYEEE